MEPDANRARLHVLLTLMANVDDTNILIRSNPQTLEYAQEEARRLLLSHPIITDQAMEELAALNREFVARNISPGGCADLLAIAIFFVRLQELMDERKDRDQPCCKANSAPRKRLTLTWKN